MSTYAQILYQIVFGTKSREPALNPDNRSQLFKYLQSILENKKIHLYRINGTEDHVHIITHLHQSLALSDLVKDIMVTSSVFIKENNPFKYLIGRQEGYSACTYSISEKDILIEYIKINEEYHKRFSFRDEYVQLLKEYEVDFDEKYLL